MSFSDIVILMLVLAFTFGSLHFHVNGEHYTVQIVMPGE